MTTKEIADETLIAFGDQLIAYKSADGRGIVEALGVRFSGPDQRDFYGDYFSAETDFGPHKGNGMQATVNHRIPMYTKGTGDEAAEIMQRLARYKFANPVKAEEGEAGIIVQHVLDLSNEYEAMVYELASNGHLRWSSGTAAHLVDRDQDGHIRQWPVIEWAYTPQPAEPRLPRILPLRKLPAAIMDMYKLDEVETEGQEGAGSAPPPVTEASDDNAKSLGSGDDTMSEEKQAAPVEEAPQKNEGMAELLAAVKAMNDELTALKGQVVNDVPAVKGKAPHVSKTGLGDTPTKAIAHWLRTQGQDTGGVKHLMTGQGEIDLYRLTDEYKASNATDMNITTDADGGYAVPTGHYQGIIARRDEEQISNRVGVMSIPGKGTTVNVPVDNEDDGEFVSTNEAAQFDLDAPAINQVAMTLAKYTKRMLLSDELLWDEDSRLLSFIENWVGRGMARTHNSLFITKVLAGGTAALTLDAAAAISASEIPELEYKLAEPYMNGATWIMQHATVGYLRGIQATTSAGQFVFAQTPYANRNGMQFSIDGYPVETTAYMGAIGGGNKSLIFGNFSFVGNRTDPSIKLIIDPYTRADYGQVRYLYQFRTVYEVLQAEALQYATHPTG